MKHSEPYRYKGNSYVGTRWYDRALHGDVEPDDKQGTWTFINTNPDHHMTPGPDTEYFRYTGTRKDAFAAAIENAQAEGWFAIFLYEWDWIKK